MRYSVWCICLRRSASSSTGWRLDRLIAAPTNQRTGAQLRHLNCHTAAACPGLPSPVENLDRKHPRGAYNPGARLDFCPLQGIVIAVDFLPFRWRSSISSQERFSRTSFAKFAHSTPRRAVARAAPCVMRNRLAAGCTVELASSGMHAGCLTLARLRDQGSCLHRRPPMHKPWTCRPAR